MSFFHSVPKDNSTMFWDIMKHAKS